MWWTTRRRWWQCQSVMSWCLVIYNLLSGHQDVDGRSCSLHPCLVTAATLRCSQPDGSWDKYVNISPPLPINQVPGSMSNFRYPYINIIWFCCHWLAMSNSSYNPFIYLLCNVSASLTKSYRELPHRIISLIESQKCEFRFLKVRS